MNILLVEISASPHTTKLSMIASVSSMRSISSSGLPMLITASFVAWKKPFSVTTPFSCDERMPTLLAQSIPYRSWFQWYFTSDFRPEMLPLTAFAMIACSCGEILAAHALKVSSGVRVAGILRNSSSASSISRRWGFPFSIHIVNVPKKFTLWGVFIASPHL